MKIASFLKSIFLLSALLGAELGHCKEIPAVTTFTLPNGVRILLKEDHKAPKAYVGMLWRMDHYYSRAGNISHYLQILLDGGLAGAEWKEVTKRKSVKATEYTVKDASGFRAEMSKLDLLDYLKADRRRFESLTLDPDLLKKSVEGLRFDFEQTIKHDGMSYIGFEALNYLAFHDVRYSIPSGNPDQWNKIPPAELQIFFDRNYTANHLTLSVVGDFDSKVLTAELTKLWSDYPQKRPADKGFTFDVQSYKKSDEIEIPVLPFDRRAIVLGFPIPESRHKDRAPIALISSLISGKDGALERELVAKKKALRYETDNAMALRPTLYSIYVEGAEGVSAEDLKNSVRTALESIGKSLNQRDLEAAKEKMIVNFESYTLDPKELAISLAEYDLFNGSYLSYYGQSEEFSKITLNDLRRVLDQYFLSPKTRYAIVLKQSKGVEEAAKPKTL